MTELIFLQGSRRAGQEETISVCPREAQVVVERLFQDMFRGWN